MRVMGLTLGAVHAPQKKRSDCECLLLCELVSLQHSKDPQPQPCVRHEYGLEGSIGDVCSVVFDKAGRILFA